jgi:UDP-perosamine 4-acetyltransferase
MKAVVIGGGGHACVVIEAAQAAGAIDLVGVIDADAAKRDVLGVPVIGQDGDLPHLKARGIEGFIIGLGHSRSLAARTRLFQQAVAAGLTAVIVVHPRATIAASARIAPGVAILSGATVNAEAVVDENVILNTGSIVEHHCRIGAHSHVAPGAILCGGVQLGREVLVGAGAIVREGVRIGAGATVGLGGIVIRDVPAGLVVVGNPARTLHERGPARAT